jgi:ATP adenylyltransferase
MEYMSKADDDAGGCIFCDQLAEDDDESARILYRGPAAFVILNAFPYNAGHLMIAPHRHVGELGDTRADERRELMDLTSSAVEIIRSAMDPHGFNIGINLGKPAGAGVLDHVHVHVVPRWNGDTNFMTVVGEMRVLPENLGASAARLRPIFARLNQPEA